MHRFLLCIALLIPLIASGAIAQPAPESPPPDEDEEEPFESPRLRRPEVEPPNVTPVPEEEPAEPEPAPGAAGEAEAGDAESGEGAAEEQQEGSLAGEASPDAAAGLLEQAEPGDGGGPPSADPTMAQWTAPESVLTLHGYFRVRGEVWDNFMLDPALVTAFPRPFGLFAPLDRDAELCPAGAPPGEGQCGGSRLSFANMRMRLRPTLAISDDVRVHMMVDVFDNLVLGSTPNSEAYIPNQPAGSAGDAAFRLERGRTPGQPIDSFADTQNPPNVLRNSFQDSIQVRRAWAEVTNRGIGQLRFGRMGSQWGLGIFQNAGEGIDSDFSTEVDRIMGITKVAGFYFVAAWDWAAEGVLTRDLGNLRSFAWDGTSRDDVRQWTLAVARRTDEEEKRARLQRGDWVLNGGLYFMIRKQDTSSAGIADPFDDDVDVSGFFRRDMRQFVPDLWGQFLWKNLRLEAEAVLVAGKIDNVLPDQPDPDDEDLNLLQFGFAFEGEYRLLEEKLGIYLYTGLATGDPDVDGLSGREDLLTQSGGDDRISTFAFHPDYRIDLILWRNLMQRVAGAWYLRPGVSYDFLRNSFGQLLGARFDVIYSRATAEVQTYGSDPNLGLEMDVSAYYRSEDGPELMDGFHAMAQFGILFPFDGLGTPGSNPVDPGNAWVFRALLGVQF